MAKKKMLYSQDYYNENIFQFAIKFITKSQTSAEFSQSYSFESVQLLLLCDNLLCSGSQSLLL